MFKDEKRKLIIVCNTKTKIYANQLSQLISAKDDNGNEVIGSKDGTVVASVWEEKHYRAQEPNISSEQKILFIGDMKSSKSVTPNIIHKFQKHGINYGWLGNKAVIYVDNKLLNKEEYDHFSNFYKRQQRDFKERIELKQWYSNIYLKSFLTVINPYHARINNLILKKKNKKIILKKQYHTATYHFYMNSLTLFLED